MDSSTLARSIKKVASRWSDPDYPVRVSSIEQTLAESNGFTLESINFAVDQIMAAVHEYPLASFEETTTGSKTIAVINPGNVPFVGLPDMLATWVSGREYFGVLSSKSPHLLPAFGYDLVLDTGRESIEFGTFEDACSCADAFVVTGSDATIEQLRHIFAGRQSLLRGSGYSVGLLTPEADADVCLGLAEDILMHEGLGCRNVSVLWVPNDSVVDEVTRALQLFRAVFPAHESTSKRLKYEQALMAAADRPHIAAEDHSFLISKGGMPNQSPCHLRICYYDCETTFVELLQQDDIRIQYCVTNDSSLDKKVAIPCIEPGTAHRQPLYSEIPSQNILRFFDNLAARTSRDPNRIE